MLEQQQNMCRLGSGTLRNHKMKGKLAALAPACFTQIKPLLQIAPCANSNYLMSG